MRKNDEKFNKHCTKSAFYAINNVHGITLTTLVVTIVVLLILAGVATYSGIEAIDNTKRTKFIAELKIMQSYVNQWYEDCKPSVNAKKYEETFASNVQTKFTINDKVAVNVASTEPINSEKVTIAQAALAAANVPSENYGNFYLLEDNEKSALGVEGVSQAVLVSVRDRKVVSYLGLKYKGNMYYTIDSLDSENGIDAIYNVGYENPNTNTPTLQITGKSIYNGETAKGAKYKFTVDVKYKFPGDVIQDSDHINKGDLYYGKIENGEVKNWNKTEDKTFIVDREGTYKIYYKDAAGNESGPIDYVIEPKTTLISSSTINVYMKQLSGQENARVYDNNTTITLFKTAVEKPNSTFLNNTNLVKNIAAVGSLYPVYIWYDNGTIWYYSDDNWIGLNSYGGQFFEYLKALTEINLYQFDTRNTTNMDYMFLGCTNITNLNLSNFNTQNVTSMMSMFNACNKLTTVDISSFNTQNVTNMSGMFKECNKLTSIDLSSFNTRNVTDISSMFRECSKLNNLDLSHFDTSNVTAMNHMFYYCPGLTSLNISNFNTQNVTNMMSMFYNCGKLTSLDVSHFNTQNVTNMSYMFYGCSEVSNLNLSHFNTFNVTTMQEMFRGCSNLTSLDLSSFNTENVTNMYYMFYLCRGLTSLDLSNFNTGNVTIMSGMFYGCNSLSNLDVSRFDTQNVISMQDMFRGCSDLSSLDVSSFKTQNVNNMTRMFYQCSNLTNLNISGFNTQEVIGMTSMFGRCGKLTSLDLSSFDTSKVLNMWSMFINCSNLTTIYVSDSFVTTALTNEAIGGAYSEDHTASTHLFDGCTSLVGGSGTAYRSANTDKTYARIDYIDAEHPENSTPGYFTRKTN